MIRSMVRGLSLVLLGLLCIRPASSQGVGWEKGAHYPAMIPEKAYTTHQGSRASRPAADSYVPPDSFRVLHYRFDVWFDMTSGEMGGRVTMKLVSSQLFSALTLNAAYLQIDSVSINGVRSGSVSYPTPEQFSVSLPVPAGIGDTLNVAIDYRRLSGIARPSGRQGYYYYNPTALTGLPDTLGYTMSAPSDTRCWLPCFDEPWMKSTAEIHATVPQGFVAASNGRFLGTSMNGDGTITWHWNEGHPIATYLLCVTISKWAVSTLGFARAAGDTVPVQYYTWRADSLTCAGFLPTVRRMVSTLGALFGPYAFDKYGMTGVVPFAYGGMEHQTLTTLHRAYLINEDIVVHELAHQWWGDDVTCGTWSDIWLNESFASYAEALWHESVSGPAALQSYMLTAHLRFFMGSWVGSIYDPVGQGFGLFPNSVYSKGAWVLHTLRGVLGDSIFFQSIRAYRAKYRGGAAITDELRAVVDSVSGRSMHWFFDEWIYGTGWPQYASIFHRNDTAVVLTIYQRQRAQTGQNLWPIYVMPIQMRANITGGRDTLFTVLDSAETQSFPLHLDFMPDSVTLDPANWVLKQIVDVPTAVETPPQLPLTMRLEQNYPNPFNPTSDIRYQISEVSYVRLVVYDLLGRQVAVVVDELKAPGNYTVRFSAKGGSAFGGDGRNLASGAYFYRMTAGSFVETKRMLLVR